MPRPVMAEPVVVALTCADDDVTDDTTGVDTDSGEPPPLPLSLASSLPQAASSRPAHTKKLLIFTFNIEHYDYFNY